MGKSILVVSFASCHPLLPMSVQGPVLSKLLAEKNSPIFIVLANVKSSAPREWLLNAENQAGKVIETDIFIPLQLTLEINFPAAWINLSMHGW